MSEHDSYGQDSLRHSQPTEADERIGDVVVILTNPEDESCCGILSRLQTLNQLAGSGGVHRRGQEGSLARCKKQKKYMLYQNKYER